MSELGTTAAALRPVRFALPAAPISHPFYETLATILLCPILLSVAVWNGFPIIFYDTGAYMLQGLGHVFIAERSPIYSGFLWLTGGDASLWFVAAAQCAITASVVNAVPGFATTTATTASTQRGCGTPTTATSETSGRR